MYSFFMPGLCSLISCSLSPSPTNIRSSVPLVGSSNPFPSHLPPTLADIYLPLSYNTNKHDNPRPTLHAYSFAAFPTPSSPPQSHSYLPVPPPAFLPSSPSAFVYYSSVVNAVHLLHDITLPCNLWSFIGSQTAQNPLWRLSLSLPIELIDTSGYISARVSAVSSHCLWLDLITVWWLYILPRGSVDLCGCDYDLARSCAMTRSLSSWRWWQRPLIGPCSEHRSDRTHRVVDDNRIVPFRQPLSDVDAINNPLWFHDVDFVSCVLGQVFVGLGTIEAL